MGGGESPRLLEQQVLCVPCWIQWSLRRHHPIASAEVGAGGGLLLPQNNKHCKLLPDTCSGLFVVIISLTHTDSFYTGNMTTVCQPQEQGTLYIPCLMHTTFSSPPASHSHGQVDHHLPTARTRNGV